VLEALFEVLPFRLKAVIVFHGVSCADYSAMSQSPATRLSFAIPGLSDSGALARSEASLHP
jgi:hypothetical protein